MYHLKYHHLGIPTRRELPSESYNAGLKVYASGYSDSAYGIEWMKFDDDCTIPDLVKTVPHIAFVVDNLKEALEGKEIIIQPNSPSEGVTVAFIVDNGAPIELLQFEKPGDEIWPHNSLFK